MEFEWDVNKNQQNILKHGIDFQDAKRIFDKPMLRRTSDRKDYGEQRWFGLGQLDGAIVVAIYTLRQEKIRLISVRRANHEERRIYNEAFGEPD